MSGIKKRDRDLDWILAYRDLENPGRIKAKQSSNMVFIGAVSVIGIAAIFYVQLMNENLKLTRQIKEHQAYMSDERNIDLKEWHELLKVRSASLINYRDGAEKFLDQLKNTGRVSEEEFRFYETALKESTASESIITGYSTDYNMVTIKGIVSQQDMPRMYAEYLANLTDEEGNPRFASVEYSGFSKNKDSTYEFTIKVIWWKKLK